MRYRYLAGDKDKPLLLAYHGLGQKSVGLVSWLPLYRSFPHMSRLFASCGELGWSCFMPQAGGMVFRIDKTLTHVQKAREITGSTGKLYLFGFSMGAETVYQAANFLSKDPLNGEYSPAGIWGHSGRAPQIGKFYTHHPYKVALTCNREEDHVLPFNDVSMRDERKRALAYYTGRDFCVRTEEGSANGAKVVHRCDPSLNIKLLSWLNS